MIGILEYGKDDLSGVLRRDAETDREVARTVAGIIAEVREKGDEALLGYAERFDGAKLTSLVVSEDELAEGVRSVDPEFARVLRLAAGNIENFHRRQARPGFIITDTPGVVCGQRVTPIEKVGVYVPGGTAAYPSSVLMNVIPAKIAGCREIVVATPPGPDGKVNPGILAAASVAGATKIYKIGGAGAIAALAYGTRTVPAVDKIVGPGNAYVAEAKRQVFGRVGIDMVAGPSEILIIADGSADPRYLAADLLSQAEHDKMATAVLLTDSPDLATAVREELERQIPLLRRAGIARASIDNNGKIIIVPDIPAAVELANRLAPEHLELYLDRPFDVLGEVKNAGSVFLGKYCPEAFGDYLAGPNHTLPTSGTARFSSPLSVDDFVKKTQYTYYSEDACGAVAGDVALFAEREGLTAHAGSATVRLAGEKR